MTRSREYVPYVSNKWCMAQALLECPELSPWLTCVGDAKGGGNINKSMGNEFILGGGRMILTWDPPFLFFIWGEGVGGE